MYLGDVLYYNTVDWRTGWHVDVPGSYSALDMPHHAQATAARLIPSKDYFVDKNITNWAYSIHSSLVQHSVITRKTVPCLSVCLSHGQRAAAAKPCSGGRCASSAAYDTQAAQMLVRL